jgi:CRP-like cAMP-binding protein
MRGEWQLIKMSFNSVSLKTVISILLKHERTSDEVIYLLGYLHSLPDLCKYLTSIPRDKLLQMCAEITAQQFTAREVIFNKGEVSDRFFLIVKGRVEIFNLNKEGEVIFKTFIGNGKRLGEQGVITSQPRSLSAVAEEDSVMIVMPRTQFKTYLETGFLTELDMQLDCIKNFLPSIEHYSHIQRIMIAYCLKSETYRRGQAIIVKGSIPDKLYIVVTGEAAILADTLTGKRSILKLAVGSLFGEEGVFLTEKAKYTVVCSSERVNVFTIQRFDALKVFPEEICNSIVSRFKAKDINRTTFATVKARLEPKLKVKAETKDNPFVWASPFARKSLEKMRLNKTISSNSSLDESFQMRKSLLIKYAEEPKYDTHKTFVFRKRRTTTSCISNSMTLPKLEVSVTLSKKRLSPLKMQKLIK